jgi:hypothetical protein
MSLCCVRNKLIVSWVSGQIIEKHLLDPYVIKQQLLNPHVFNQYWFNPHIINQHFLTHI